MSEKSRYTFHLSNELVERLKNACHATGCSISQVVEESVSVALSKLEEANGGQPYPERPKSVKFTLEK